VKIAIKTAALVAAAGLGLGFSATPASAQATRTWVSGVGDDANPCSRTAPCKTFAGAISKTAAGGEINCLDPAGFGAVTLTKSITIDCTGTLGGILASSTTGVIVNGAGAIVVLRGLEINGGPPNLPGVNGIRFLQGASLTVEDSTIYNFLGAAPNGNGIIVNPTSGALRLFVTNTYINNNNNSGIEVVPAGTASVRVVLQDVRAMHNVGAGVRFNSSGTSTPAGVQGSIDGSNLSSNGQGFLAISSGATANSLVMLTNSSVNNNTTFGIQTSGAAARARVGNTNITLNGTGVNAINTADVQTYGNNRLNGNTVDGAFNLPALGEQ
jgi:hypothetical protein